MDKENKFDRFLKTRPLGDKSHQKGKVKYEEIKEINSKNVSPVVSPLSQSGLYSRPNSLASASLTTLIKGSGLYFDMT